MEYAELPPPPALHGIVECVWRVEGAGEAGERILPDGRAELVFHLGDPFCGEDGTPQPAAVLVGQITHALALRPGPRVRTLGVRFRPAALGALVEGAGQLTDCAIPADAVWGRAAARCGERLAEASGDAARLAAIAELLGPGRACDPLVEEAARQVFAARGMIPVAALAAAVQLSPRQLERRFRAGTGLSPRTLARIARLQHLLVLSSEAERPAWVDVALEAGFFDQSHLVREVTAFAGIPPTRLLAGAGQLSSRFTDPARLRAILAG